MTFEDREHLNVVGNPLSSHTRAKVNVMTQKEKTQVRKGNAIAFVVLEKVSYPNCLASLTNLERLIAS